MVVSECSLVIKALFPLWWIISSWSGKNLNLASSYRMCRFFFSWASGVVLSGIGRYAASIHHHFHPPPREYSLIWPIRGCAVGQGMGLVLSVQKRVHNSAQVSPKWGFVLNSRVYIFRNFLVLQRVMVWNPQQLTYTKILVEYPSTPAPRHPPCFHVTVTNVPATVLPYTISIIKLYSNLCGKIWDAENLVANSRLKNFKDRLSSS